MKRAPKKLEKPVRGKVTATHVVAGGGEAFYKVPNTVTKVAITFTTIIMKQHE